MSKLNLAVCVICGGTSSEASVSRSSAKEVERALRASFNHVSVLELDSSLPDKLLALRPDVVFPVLHGAAGEDGTVQGFLEIMGIPYVGSGVAASAYAMNKHCAKQLFRSAGLPVARDRLVKRTASDVDTIATAILSDFPNGVVIKPIDQGSAIGVSFAKTPDEIHAGLHECFKVSEYALVEEWIVGREITAGILDTDGIQRLPVVEIRSIGGWYDFEHRYAQGASEHIIPAPLDVDIYERVQLIAQTAHQTLGCRDLSRADFVVTTSGEIYLLEVNTLPGMTATSLYPDSAKAAGIEFEKLVHDLVLSAGKRKLHSQQAVS